MGVQENLESLVTWGCVLVFHGCIPPPCFKFFIDGGESGGFRLDLWCGLYWVAVLAVFRVHLEVG